MIFHLNNIQMIVFEQTNSLFLFFFFFFVQSISHLQKNSKKVNFFFKKFLKEIFSWGFLVGKTHEDENTRKTEQNKKK